MSMIRRGRRLQAIAQTLPCALTLRLLLRQVERIERLQAVLWPPRSHVAETFGRLYTKPEHPVARAHQARLAREREDEEGREIMEEFQQLIDEMRNLNARSDSASGRLRGSPRQRQHGRRSAAAR